MKLLHFMIITYLISCYNLMGTNQFIDEKTNHILSIKIGTKEDLNWAKEFCINFFKRIYNVIPLDEDQQLHGSYENFINYKFGTYYEKIFTLNKYKFFIVEDSQSKKNIGYTIVDEDSNKIYGIETQASIETYSIKSLMNALAIFLKNELYFQAEYFVSSVRKKMPQFIEILKTCGFEEEDSSLLHPSMSCDYYQALIYKF